MADGPKTSGQHPDDTATVLMLLNARVPLTLLIDLASPIHSVDVYRAELDADPLTAEVA
jgi:hypothetical protein